MPENPLHRRLINFVKQYLYIIFPSYIICVISRDFAIIRQAYYLVPIFLVAFLIAGINDLKGQKNFRISILLFVPFICWICISAFWSATPLTTLVRSCYFTLIAFGSVWGAYTWNKQYKEKFLGYLLPASLFVIFSCAISLILKYPIKAWKPGFLINFRGFAGHHNSLAGMLVMLLPIVLFTLWMAAVRYKKGSKPDALNTLFWVLLACFGFELLVLSTSRAGVLSFVFFVALTGFILSRKRIFIVSIMTVALIGTLIITQNKAVNNFANNFLTKGYNTFDVNRARHFKYNLAAAKSGGLIGFGYGTFDPYNSAQEVDPFIKRKMGTERLNSPFAIVEQTGLIGLLLFILPLLMCLWSLFKGLRKAGKAVTEAKIKLAFLFAFILSMVLQSQFEGWWIGTGGIYLPLYLTLLYRSDSPE